MHLQHKISNIFSYTIIVTLIAFLSVFTVGCETMDNPVAPANDKGGKSLNQIDEVGVNGPFGPIAQGQCENGFESQLYCLWAGQNRLAGTVTVSNDATNIYVTFDTDESADLSAVHVYVYTDVNDLPGARPAPGQTPYKQDGLNVDSYTISIPFANLNAQPNCDDVYYVIAHAAMTGDNAGDNEVDQDSNLNNAGQTAYAGGTADQLPNVGGGGGSWFYIAAYTITCCEDEQGEDPIEGTVFYDLNGNGMQDEGESGIPGVEVTLSNGSVVTTDENGYYLFDNLNPGDYTVSVSGYNGREATTPTSVDVTTDYNVITVVNFGFEPYHIDGVVFYDINENGIQDNGEPGIGGVTVTLDGNTTVTTDENGYYIFEGLLPGDYNVTVGEYNDRGHTTPASVNVTISTDDETVNFGFEPYHIDGVIFYDVNGNGSQDADEPGLAGVQVTLNGSVTVTTDQNGNYVFEGLLPGDYAVTVAEVNGFNATTSTSVNVTISNDDATVGFGFGFDFEFICGGTANGFTIGFWKNNLEKAISGRTKGIQVSAALLNSYTTAIADFMIEPFDGITMPGAVSVLGSTSSDAVNLLKKQLLGSEYNFMNSAFINGNQLVTWAFICYGEYVVKHSGEFSRDQILNAKDWYDAYNNSHGGQFFGPGCGN